ncbi:hypothetical protein, partial [Priestia megaterium]|uniref:hypothetical protein n=1 Tax=Priestia megaterium TaxID=1404 RepID=UPI00372D08D6
MGKFDDRFIQVKSFPGYAEAEEYVRSSPLHLVAFLATNGWFAIALRGSLEHSRAISLLAGLKAE